MKHYRIYSLNHQGGISRARDLDCADDLDALSQGEKLSAENPVEIWQGSRRVARVKPGNAPLDVRDQQSL